MIVKFLTSILYENKKKIAINSYLIVTNFSAGSMGVCGRAGATAVSSI